MWFKNLPPPPVPAGVCEQLKDYPELIEDLQDIFNRQVDQATQQTINRNLANSPQGMAQQFRQAYEQNGWSRFGAVPEYAIF